jgi:hypothetical protein
MAARKCRLYKRWARFVLAATLTDDIAPAAAAAAAPPPLLIVLAPPPRTRKDHGWRGGLIAAEAAEVASLIMLRKE